MLIIKKHNYLLFVKPANKPSPIAVIDELTMKMAAALRAATSTNANFRGVHRCTGTGCKAKSTNTDYVLSNNLTTHSLAVHYLAHHREEIPDEELRKVARLPETGVHPDQYELEGRYQSVTATR